MLKDALEALFGGDFLSTPGIGDLVEMIDVGLTNFDLIIRLDGITFHFS